MEFLFWRLLLYEMQSAHAGQLCWIGNVASSIRLKLMPEICAVKRELSIRQEIDLVSDPEWREQLKSHPVVRDLNSVQPTILGIALIKPLKCFEYRIELSDTEQCQYRYWLKRCLGEVGWQQQLRYWELLAWLPFEELHPIPSHVCADFSWINTIDDHVINELMQAVRKPRWLLEEFAKVSTGKVDVLFTLPTPIALMIPKWRVFLIVC